MQPSLTRRTALAGTASLVVSAAAPSNLPAQPSLLVAGPAGSRVGRWAGVIAPPLGQIMLGGPPLGWTSVGGVDGVTGVNQFQAQVNPDGATALLLPGDALLAWLAGDGRVRFDAGSWAPLWGGSTSALVVTRAPLVAGRPVRIAVDSVVGPVLEALLALHMMGIDAIPVPGGSAPLRRDDVDVAYLRGEELRTIGRQDLSALGWAPAFSLGNRDPAGPPAALELFRPDLAANPMLQAAFRAVSAAASLEVALVLRAITPATVLAWWRRGCEQLDDDPAVRAAGVATGVRQDDAGAIAAQLSAVALDTAGLLALRSLLAERYGWRPG